MNKNVRSLLWKVTEVTVLAVAEKIAGMLADKTVSSLDKKTDKKLSK